MKSVLYLVTAVSISLAASTATAQTPTPDTGNLNQLNRRPIQQPGIFSNPNNGSRQFFQQGKDNLYFLEESEPVLQIEQKNEDGVESEKKIENDKIQDSTEVQEQAE